MMIKTVFKASISTLVLATALNACRATPTDAAKPVSTTPARAAAKLPPVRKALDCLPPEAALLAAHRGTDKSRTDLPENSMSSLKAVLDHGIQMAEIDVASTKDGTLFTFHDGVWEEDSTGSGAVAASMTTDLDNILLKTTDGKVTADRPARLSDMIAAAKGRAYLEIDFKSSADPKVVIDALRAADMTDQVLLIAYNPEQAAMLEKHAPDMLRSNPTSATQATHAVWLGYNVGNGDTAKTLKTQDNYVIGRIGDPKRQPALSVLADAADILVVDDALNYDTPVLGLTDASRAAYEACLAG